LGVGDAHLPPNVRASEQIASRGAPTCQMRTIEADDRKRHQPHMESAQGALQELDGVPPPYDELHTLDAVVREWESSTILL